MSDKKMKELLAGVDAIYFPGNKAPGEEGMANLAEILHDYTLTEHDIAAIGRNVCDALIACEQRHILHRNIKIEKIFVDAMGNFKLGGFDVAISMDELKDGMMRVGTQMYMAPELYQGKAADHRIDIYSLGITLYRLANHGKFPFVENENSKEEKENALRKRLRGAKMPLPSGVDQELGMIILKACAYKPEDRYTSAAQLKRDLEQWLQRNPNQTALHMEQKENTARFADEAIPNQAKHSAPKAKSANNTLLKIVIGLAGVAACLVVALIVFNMINPKSGKEVAERTTEIKAEEREPLEEATTEAAPEATTEAKVTTAADELKEKIAKAQVGDTIEMGQYQGQNVEWKVIDKKEDKNIILVVSNYIIEQKAYNDSAENITWENSSLKGWLNGEFYDGTFKASEADLIYPYDEEQGKIFMLSETAASTYFPSDDERKCGMKENNTPSTWWLRSTPNGKFRYVDENGVIQVEGKEATEPLGIRPAMWLTIPDVTITEDTNKNPTNENGNPEVNSPAAPTTEAGNIDTDGGETN